MLIICPNCGRQTTVEDGVDPGRFSCPACGRAGGTPPRGELETSPADRQRQERRRTALMIAVLVLAILALLLLLLLHRSTPDSPARRVKNAIFGKHITELVENRDGQDGGNNGTETPDGGPNGNTPPPVHSSETNGPASGPINPQLPTNNPPDHAAPPPRTIGWLDRFFGTQSQPEAPPQPGEGGTSPDVPGAGNTNLPPPLTTNAAAAENTVSNPPAPATDSAQTPATRPTTRPPPVNTINDNFEELLRQHRAGSGDVRVSLMWSNYNDIDLHVVEPSGEEIFYAHRESRTHGLLDVDMNATSYYSPAVENVFWPRNAAPAGTYRVYVNHYSLHDSVDPTAYTVRVLVRGQTTDLTGAVYAGGRKKLVYQFTLGPPGR